MQTKCYNAKYIKKSGEEREMNFVRFSDLPETFLSDRIKGDAVPRNLGEGREVVWDVDNSGFRVFNWNTIVGEAVETTVEVGDDNANL